MRGGSFRPFPGMLVERLRDGAFTADSRFTRSLVGEPVFDTTR